jgi:hypothetical protein
VSSPWLAPGVFVCVLGAFVGGYALSTRLPAHHLSTDSKDSVKQMLGLLSTLTALVVGLLISSAKESFEVKSNGIVDVATEVILLDRVLAWYGPETATARGILRASMERSVDELWTQKGFQRARMEQLDEGGALGGLQASLRELTPQNDGQRQLQSRALSISADLARSIWGFRLRQGGSIPAPFLAVLVAWLIVIFASMGILSPRNSTVLAVAVATSLAVSAAIFLILELDTPYGGVIRVSDAPLRGVIEHLGR